MPNRSHRAQSIHAGTTALYRFRDARGCLLYVGITYDPAKRFPQHSAQKPWWHEVASITLEQHPTRRAAEAAEAEAIRTERPLYNITHNDTTPILWRCALCGRGVAFAGMVAVDLAGASVTRPAQWRAWHNRCADPDAEPYWLPVEDIRTREQAIHVTRRLRQKRWYDRTDWHEVVVVPFALEDFTRPDPAAPAHTLAGVLKCLG